MTTARVALKVPFMLLASSEKGLLGSQPEASLWCSVPCGVAADEGHVTDAAKVPLEAFGPDMN